MFLVCLRNGKAIVARAESKGKLMAGNEMAEEGKVQLPHGLAGFHAGCRELSWAGFPLFFSSS